MKIRLLPVLLLSSICMTSSCSSNKQEKAIAEKSDFPENPHWCWILITPENTEPCKLWLSFQEKGKLKFSYRGFLFDGTYQFDPELPNYVYINIPTRPGWNEDCKVTPDYLSLYNDDTDFAWTIVGDFMYFKKMDNVLIFKKEVMTSDHSNS